MFIIIISSSSCCSSSVAVLSLGHQRLREGRPLAAGEGAAGRDAGLQAQAD